MIVEARNNQKLHFHPAKIISMRYHTDGLQELFTIKHENDGVIEKGDVLLLLLFCINCYFTRNIVTSNSAQNIAPIIWPRRELISYEITINTK